jgi:putative ABC transport system permease protein
MFLGDRLPIVQRYILAADEASEQAALTKNLDSCGYRLFTHPNDLDKVLTGVSELTKNSPMPAQGISSTQYRAGIARRASTIPTVLGFLGLFLVFTTALTLANNTAISIRERRVEVATMRVLGYKPRTIAWLLISEAVLVGLFGGLLAVATMFLAFRGGVQLTPKDLLPPATMGSIAIAAGLAMSVLVPLLGALPSALGAVRVPLVDGLRDA